MTHLYCLAVQAGFYSVVVECWSVTQAARVRSTAAALVIRIFSPVTLDPIYIIIRSELLHTLSCNRIDTWHDKEQCTLLRGYSPLNFIIEICAQLFKTNDVVS